MDFNQILQGQLGDGLIQHLSQQIGSNDTQATATAANGIVSTLLAALQRNSATPEGANALATALDKDHNGSILGNIMDMITTQNVTQPAEKALNGPGILGHILGDKQAGAADMISQISGLNNNQTGSLMSMLAPIVMGALGMAKQNQGVDSSGLGGLLGGLLQSQQQQSGGNSPLIAMATSFLDQDKDGSIMDDLAGMGAKILGGFFKK